MRTLRLTRNTAFFGIIYKGFYLFYPLFLFLPSQLFLYLLLFSFAASSYNDLIKFLFCLFYVGLCDIQLPFHSAFPTEVLHSELFAVMLMNREQEVMLYEEMSCARTQPVFQQLVRKYYVKRRLKINRIHNEVNIDWYTDGILILGVKKSASRNRKLFYFASINNLKILTIYMLWKGAVCLLWMKKTCSSEQRKSYPWLSW